MPKAIALLMAGAALAAASPYDDRAPVDEVAQVERDFARDFTGKQWQSFLDYSAEDAITIFDEMLPAKQFYGELVKASAGRPPSSLDWWPGHVEVACANDLAWSTGPTLRKAKAGDVHSHYVTVWKREENGQWRWVFDRGVQHAAPADPHPRGAPPTTVSRAYCAKEQEASGAAEKAFLEAEDRLTSTLARDAEAAIKPYLGPFSTVHRWKRFPARGVQEGLALVRQGPQQVVSERSRYGMSQSGDLAYTYGKISWRDDNGKPAQGFYLRVWRNTGRGWEIAMDQVNPINTSE
ncbi:MAG TPA: hypothetical protein VGD10_12090 [Allosphingosinicella sp.]|uniref:hypothetical protein n=1 Tax=Allosphingosinicella sp. TaxID=2823234 RepID=UPI002EDB16A6